MVVSEVHSLREAQGYRSEPHGYERSAMPGSLSTGAGSSAPQPDTPPSKRVRRQGEDGSPERRGLSGGAADGAAAGAAAGDGAHSKDETAMNRWVLLLSL